MYFQNQITFFEYRNIELPAASKYHNQLNSPKAVRAYQHVKCNFPKGEQDMTGLLAYFIFYENTIL